MVSLSLPRFYAFITSDIINEVQRYKIKQDWEPSVIIMSTLPPFDADNLWLGLISGTLDHSDNLSQLPQISWSKLWSIIVKDLWCTAS